MPQHTDIAIIWASFAWLSALLVLRKRLGDQVTIKLFDEREQFCHIPALHEAVLAPRSRLRAMQLSLSRRYHKEFIHAQVSKIASNQLQTSDGQTRTFDYAVIATGSRTNFLQNEKRERIAYAVRYADDIPKINTKLRDSSTKIITVVGGGYTGVEIASIIAQRKRPDQHLRVIHSKHRLFDRLDSSISKQAITRLKKHHVEVLLEEKVSDIDTDRVTFVSGKQLPSDMTIISWGIKLNDESFSPHLTFTKNYHAEESEGIYLCGDVASHGLIATAHNAMFEGRRMGQLIADKVQGVTNSYPPLENRDKLAIALGRRDGIITNGHKAVYIPFLLWIAKRVIERRVLFEFTRRVMLRV